MPCPVPSHMPTPPSLSTLLEELVAVDATRAQEYRTPVAEMEARQLKARQELAAAESDLSLVKADGTRPAHSDWCLRSTDVNNRRRELRLLGVDADSLRAVLERQLFLARQSQAIGRVVCPACEGSGDGELIAAGTCLVPTSCDPCGGTGYATTRPPA
jgi:hypothetical protein